MFMFVNTISLPVLSTSCNIDIEMVFGACHHTIMGQGIGLYHWCKKEKPSRDARAHSPVFA
jgi:hypothetical protein